MKKKLKRKIISTLTNTIIYKLYLRYKYKIKPYNSVVVELTDKCNLECSYCPKGHGIGIGKSFLDIDDFKAIFDKLNRELNLKEIILVGFGEPLLYKNIVEAIEYIYSKNSKIYTYLTTNGILYDANMAKKLSEAGLKQITVSLNFVDKDSYIKYNRSDFFDRVYSNLNEISKLENIKTKIIVQILDLPCNKYKIQEYKNLIEKKWGFEFQLQPFINWGGQIENSNFVDYKKSKIERYPCAHIERNLIIQTNGDVRVCCIAMPINAKHLTIGNIFEVKNIRSIIKGDRLKKLKEKNYIDCLADLPLCKDCDAWKSIPNFYFKFNNRWY